MAQQRLGKFGWRIAMGGYQFECAGKTRWSSEEAAQRAISRIRRENPEAISSTVRPYRCSSCRRFHVGHGM